MKGGAWQVLKDIKHSCKAKHLCEDSNTLEELCFLCLVAVFKNRADKLSK